MFNRAFLQAVPSELIKCWPALSEQDRPIWNQLALFVTARSVERRAQAVYLSHMFLSPLQQYAENPELLVEATYYFDTILNDGNCAQHFKDAETLLSNRDVQQKIASKELKRLVELCLARDEAELKLLAYRQAKSDLLAIYQTARASLQKCIASIPQDTKEQIELRTVKQEILSEVGIIFNGKRESTYDAQLEKCRLVTEVLTATAKEVIDVDEYTRLMSEVGKHAWGKKLASVMTKVIPIALFAASAALMIATGGLAAPAILGLGAVTALIIAASATSGASLALAGVAAVVMWKQKKQNNIEGKLMDVIDVSPTTKRAVG